MAKERVEEEGYVQQPRTRQPAPKAQPPAPPPPPERKSSWERILEDDDE